MVSTETLQVIINAKDQLTSKVKQAEQAIKGLGSTAQSSSNTATSATTRLGAAYEQLRSKVTSVFNSIRNTVNNSFKGVASSGLAQPFLNAAEQIKQRWSSMVETIKSKLKGMTSSANTGSGFNISNAGLATLNGQITSTTGKVTLLTRAMNALGSIGGGVGNKIGAAFINAGTHIQNFKTKLGKIGTGMQSLVGGLSGVQSAIMAAFGAVGVTSLSQFTIGAAIARQKLNAVTTSITGSEAATKRLNKAISSATSGGVVGFTKVATAVQQIGIKYNLTNAQLEKTAPVLNKIGTLAIAMGKDGSQAATIMAKAYDGLNGNFMLLQRNLGITKDQLLAEGWTGAANDVDGYTRALQKVLDKKPEMQEYLNSYEGQMERLKMTVQGVGRQIGEVFLPILNTLLGGFLDLNEKCPWLTTAIVLLGVGIIGLVSALSILAPIIMMIIELQTVQAFTTLAAYWPYLLLAAAILAIIAVLAYFYTTNETVRNTMNKIGSTIQNILVKAWENLQKIVQPLVPTFQHLMDVFGRLANDLLGLFGITGDAASNFDWLGLVVQGITLFLQVLIQHITLVVQVLAAILIPVINLVVNILAALINFIISVAEAFSLLMQGDIMGFLTTLGTALWTFFSTLTSVFIQFLLQILMNLNVIFGGILLTVWAWITNLVMTMVNGAIQAVTGFITWIATLPGQFWAWLMVAWNNLVTWRNQTVAKFREAATQAVTNFINFIKTLPGRFKEWLDNTINKVVSFAKTLYDRMKSAAQDAVNGFKEKISDLPNQMWNALCGIRDKIYAGVGMLVGAIRSLAQQMWNSFTSIFSAGNSAFVQTVDLLGADTNSKLSYNVSHHFGSSNNNGSLLGQAVDLLGELVTSSNEDQYVSAELEQSGTVTVVHDVNLSGVPEGIDSEALADMIRQIMNSPEMIKQITTNRDFQRWDKKMKQKIVGEYTRHI